MIKKLNPDAEIIETNFGKVAPEKILNTHTFDFDKASASAGWIKELDGVHTPETEEYGINSFVFREKRPFHPERFWNFINQDFPGNIIRSKGLFWLASRPDTALSWGQAGGSSRFESAGVWWASMPYSERINYQSFADNIESIEERWSPKWGDRMNELVFIGQELEIEKIKNQLKACLINEKEEILFTENKPFIDPWPEA